MRNHSYNVLDLLSILVIFMSLHLKYSPFTKVEESFNIQAIHDILYYGFDLKKYDHFKFPGVVPRTFIGSLIVAVFCKPFFWFIQAFYDEDSLPSAGLELQIMARFVIGLFNAISLNRLRNAVSKCQKLSQENKDSKRKWDVSHWFFIYLITQFHLMFYSSRPLPNFIMALPLSNLTFAWVLEGYYQWSLILISFTSIVFRLELGALTLGLGLAIFGYKQLKFLQIIKFSMIGTGLGIISSLIVDSYFWQYLCLPEIESFIFNVINGKSVEWGTQPFRSYITVYLPMLFLPPTILFLNYFGFKVAHKEYKIIGLAAYIHIFLLSFQPHKEWRFIIYAITPITLLGSVGIDYLWTTLNPNSIKTKLLSLIILISPLISLVVSIFFSYVSSMNYPGGYALKDFNSMILRENIRNSTVHLDIMTCMTGATLFGQLPDSYNITYDKTENESLHNLWNSFDYVITSEKNLSNIPTGNINSSWKLISTTKGFDKINFTHIINLVMNKDFSAIPKTMNTSIPQIDMLFTYKKIYS